MSLRQKVKKRTRFERLHETYVSETKNIHNRRAHLNLQEFVRVASMDNVFDIDNGLMNLHVHNLVFRDTIRFETDAFLFAYECAGQMFDIDDIFHDTRLLTCCTKDEFDFMHNSNGMLQLIYTNPKVGKENQIDNIDDDDKVRKGEVKDNYPQEHEKYVQWMNLLAKRMKPYAQMSVEELLKLK